MRGEGAINGMLGPNPSPHLNLRRTFTLDDFHARVPLRQALHLAATQSTQSTTLRTLRTRRALLCHQQTCSSSCHSACFLGAPTRLRAVSQVVEHTPACGLPNAPSVLKPAHTATFDDGSYKKTQWTHLVWYDGAQGHGAGETCRKTQCDRVRVAAAARRGRSRIRLRGPYENSKEAEEGQSWYELQALCLCPQYSQQPS